MNDLPATRLEHVVVVNEQSGASWRADCAAIRVGRIVVPAAAVPDGFFEAPSATYRIEATNGGNRRRCFPNLALVEQSEREYVFD